MSDYCFKTDSIGQASDSGIGSTTIDYHDGITTLKIPVGQARIENIIVTLRNGLLHVEGATPGSSTIGGRIMEVITTFTKIFYVVNRCAMPTITAVTMEGSTLIVKLRDSDDQNSAIQG